jgi:hypothetical protein
MKYILRFVVLIHPFEATDIAMPYYLIIPNKEYTMKGMEQCVTFEIALFSASIKYKKFLGERKSSAR